MRNVHSCVEFFAAEFASFALSKNPVPRDSNAAPSCTETLRIKRNLYRFELYCNLFRKPSYDRMLRDDRDCLVQPSPFGTQEQREIFLKMFSPWKSEQLGCIPRLASLKESQFHSMTLLSTTCAGANSPLLESIRLLTRKDGTKTITSKKA